MAVDGIKISQLPSTDDPTGGILPISKGGTTYHIAVTDLGVGGGAQGAQGA